MAELTLAQIDHKLGYLSKEAPGIIGRAALAGVKVTIPAIRAAAGSQIGRNLKGKSISKGRMVASIGANRIKKSTGFIGAKAGPDVGKRRAKVKGSGGNHSHLFIGGTVKRETGSVRVRRAGKTVGRKLTGKAVENRGIMPAHLPSFVVTGAKSAEAAMKSAFGESLHKGIAAALEKGV